MTVEIVILAMIAAFLGLRLYSVLGRRAEHGEEPMQSRLDTQPGNAAPAPIRMTERAATPSPLRAREIPAVSAVVERGLREILAVDRRFEPTTFVEGASAAYRLILEAFWRGDKDEIGHLCEREVALSFAAAIDERRAAGEVVDNRLVRINEAVITDAQMIGSLARITLRFVADVAAITRDADGHVIAGSLDDAVEVRDVWTFAREINAAGPDWLLDETDEG